MNKFFLLFSLTLILFSVFSYLFVDSNLIYLNRLYTGFAFSNRVSVTFFYLLFVTLLFVLYLIILNAIQKEKKDIRFPKKLLIITVIVLLFSYPAMLSFDIFNYIATSKILYFYHENPYVVMPIEFQSDPLLLFMHAANKIALYGPSWILLSAIPSLLGFGIFFITLINFKLLVMAFYIGSVYLVSKMSKNKLSAYLFALNPLVIIEILVSGHNDIVMVFFALLSFFLIFKNKTKLALFSLFCSILIKYSTVFLFPVFLYVFFKKIQKREIDSERVFYYSALLMFFTFLLSPLREEFYPWYAVWFLPFVSLTPNKKILLSISLALSFGLLLRYTPFMLLGTYSGYTPLIKKLVTILPPILFLVYLFIKQRIWLKNFFRS